MTPRHGRNRTALARWRLAGVAGVALLLGALAVAVVLGCSVEKHHKTLSLFFDGVPDPGAVQEVRAGVVTPDVRKSPTYSAHKPWAEEKCEECHARMVQSGSRDSRVCLKCHADTPAQHANMHGPVAVRACLWCHNPHESAYAHLLKAPARDVCSQCHVAATLPSERVPEHAMPDRACTDCHSGHGGPQRFFLRTPRGGA